jgi:FkbM family methyltransferase
MDEFYADFVGPGSLCFDIGAHVGSRALSWSRLGATVVAVEPQPDFVRLLRWMFARNPKVTVLGEAVMASVGTLTLLVSPRTPTVTTGSPAFIANASRVHSFAWVRWDGRLEVPATTLDALIEQHGPPDFVKIDVEGMEHEVLAGLSRPIAAVSFEFVPSALDSALASVARLETLSTYRYNVSLGESLKLLFAQPINASSLRAWLADRAPESNSGDIYAVLWPTAVTRG